MTFLQRILKTIYTMTTLVEKKAKHKSINKHKWPINLTIYFQRKLFFVI